eukprot:jgi/Galph1/6106/GphlegSOOS_G4665.1
MSLSSRRVPSFLTGWVPYDCGRSSQRKPGVTRRKRGEFYFWKPLHYHFGICVSERSPAKTRRVAMTVSTGKNQIFQKGEDKIAYDYFPGEIPTVLFLPGLSMNRHSAKGNALEVACKMQGRAYLSADYHGIGRSSGDIRDGTVSRWTEDTIDIIDNLIPQGPVVLVGAGVGGWIALHVTLKRPNRISGIVGIAPDPDFTEDVLWPKLSDEVKNIIMKEGLYELPWGYRTYPISRNLIEDGRKMCLLRGSSASIPIDCPVRIIHGLNDEEIPPQRALRLADRLRSQDIVISFVKSGGHSLETEEDFQRMISSVVELCKKTYVYDLTSPQSG